MDDSAPLSIYYWLGYLVPLAAILLVAKLYHRQKDEDD